MGSLRGLYLTKPHSSLIVDGRKSIIVRGDDQDLSGEWALVEKDEALGRMVVGNVYSVPGDRFQEFYFAHRVRDNERARWWGDKDTFYFSDILAFEPFDAPVSVPVPPGTTLIIDDLPLDEKGYRLDRCMHCKAAPEIEVLWAEGKAHAWFCRKCFLEWATEGDGRGEICSAHYVKDGKIAGRWRDRTGPKLKGKSGREIYTTLEKIAVMEGEKEHTGAMIALFLPDEAAQRLALKSDSDKIKVVPPEEMHVTLCYLGDAEALADKKDVIAALVAGFAQQGGPVRGVVGGLGQFNTAEEAEGNALYASFDSPALSSFREALVAILDVAGIEPMTNHGFTPHITLAYLPPGMKPDLELPSKVPILFDSLTLAWAGEYTAYPLPQAETKAKRSRVEKFVWKRGDVVIDSKKGSAASGNWAHTSFNRIDVGRGGSDPSGVFGGGLDSLGLDESSTPDERREASEAVRRERSVAKPEALIERAQTATKFGKWDDERNDIEQWGRDHYDDWANGLKDEERYICSYYTGSGYDSMNELLRGQISPTAPYADQVREKNERLMTVLSTASVPEDVVVMRGVASDFFEDLKAIPVGGTFTDKGFTSTALRDDHTIGYKTLRIFVPRGTQAAYMLPEISNYPDESELLLNAGTRFMKLGEQGATMYFAVVQQGIKARKDDARADKFTWGDGDLVFEEEKGSAASGNWAHTSFNRIDVWKGGSDPSGTFGGGLAALGLDKDATVEERRAASAEFREGRTGKVMQRMIDAKRVIVANPVNSTPLQRKASEWADPHYADWYDSLTTEERGALRSYTGSGYKEINRYWRKGPESIYYDRHGYVKDHTRYLDSALSRAIVPEDVVVTRGVSGSTMQQIFSTEVGGTFVDKGFGSTSVAQEWPWGEKTVRILVPKGANGGYVSSTHKSLGLPDECELVLARGTRYMMMGKGIETIMGHQREVAYVAVVNQGVKGMEWGQKPYTLDNPPSRISGLPQHAKRIWISAFNSAIEQYEGDEGKANATAWAAVKHKYHKEGDQWVANKEVVRTAKGVDRIAIFAEKHNLDVEHVGAPIPFVFDREVMGTVTVVKYADQEGRKMWRGFLDFDTPIPYGEDLLHAITLGMKDADGLDEALDRAQEQLLGDEKTLLALSDEELEEIYVATQAVLADSIKSLAANLSPAQMGIVLDKVVEVVGEKGSAASGNWLHTSFNRQGVGRGGSDPAGAGGSLGKLDLKPDSTVEERRAASAQLREERDKKPTEKKPKFPTSLGDLEKVKHLGGSTGAVLVRDPETGERYVRKRGGNAEHIQEESTADQVYQALGVRVPEHKMYDDPEGPTKLAQFIEGRSLNDVRMNDAEQFEQVRERMKDRFAADALLANWDVVGLDYDNVLVDGDGNPWRIDNGGSLRFRAMGKRKTAQQWNEKPMELWTLRSASRNKRAARIFGDLPFSDVVGQLERVGARRQAILDTVPRALRGVVGGRLDAFANIARRARELRQTGMGWDAIDEAVETWMTEQ